jgi:hypothetical protein
MLAASPLDVRKGSAFPELAYHTLEATPPEVPRRSLRETKSRRPESQRLSARQTAEPFQWRPNVPFLMVGLLTLLQAIQLRRIVMQNHSR